MNNYIVSRLQAMWRGRRVRRAILYRCPKCNDVKCDILPPESSLRAFYKYPNNIEDCECDSCFQETLSNTSPIRLFVDYDDDSIDLHKGRHFCGDWICDGRCGVLWCGCIDVCRGRCGVNFERYCNYL